MPAAGRSEAPSDGGQNNEIRSMGTMNNSSSIIWSFEKLTNCGKINYPIKQVFLLSRLLRIRIYIFNQIIPSYQSLSL